MMMTLKQCAEFIKELPDDMPLSEVVELLNEAVQEAKADAS